MRIAPPLLTSRFLISIIGLDLFITTRIPHSAFCIPNSALSRPFPLLNSRQDQIDKKSQQEKNDPQGNRNIEIPAAPLHNGCRGKHSGIAFDIAAYPDGDA